MLELCSFSYSSYRATELQGVIQLQQPQPR
jgi:hypothetical protein